MARAVPRTQQSAAALPARSRMSENATNPPANLVDAELGRGRLVGRLRKPAACQVNHVAPRPVVRDVWDVQRARQRLVITRAGQVQGSVRRAVCGSNLERFRPTRQVVELPDAGNIGRAGTRRDCRARTPGKKRNDQEKTLKSCQDKLLSLTKAPEPTNCQLGSRPCDVTSKQRDGGCADDMSNTRRSGASAHDRAPPAHPRHDLGYKGQRSVLVQERQTVARPGSAVDARNAICKARPSWKKKQKTFASALVHPPQLVQRRTPSPQPREQKFFGSFFQKRTACLPCSRPKPPPAPHSPRYQTETRYPPHPARPRSRAPPRHPR